MRPFPWKESPLYWTRPTGQNRAHLRVNAENDLYPRFEICLPVCMFISWHLHITKQGQWMTKWTRYPLVSPHVDNFLKCFEYILVVTYQTVLLYCKKHPRVASQSSSHVQVFRIHLMTVNVVAEVAQDIQGDNHHAKSLFTWKTLPFISTP